MPLTLLVLLGGLALAALLATGRRSLLVVVAVDLLSLALLARSGLARSGRSTDLAASVLDLLENTVRHNLHAADRGALELGSGRVPVDLR